ncbi:MAG: hypothetical protein UY10_C0059G0003 [Microgenomates group bacterium GW2011_GWA2_47_8]|nr:MAG: hypothetical protein UY10_C0059G0003 [Microgenomates group bacterium GW2011_GWA2_47_8]
MPIEYDKRSYGTIGQMKKPDLSLIIACYNEEKLVWLKIKKQA